jgi:transcription elongation factor GreB
VSETKIPITPEGHKKLRAELDTLWLDERPRVTREVEAAAALGDRSENAEYIYGKKRLREIDSRLRFLRNRIERLRVVDPKVEHPKDGRVAFGAFVTVEDEDDSTMRWQIVGADEFDVDRGRISCESPIAKALMGKFAGDEVEVHRPRGPVALTIVRVEYE